LLVFSSFVAILIAVFVTW